MDKTSISSNIVNNIKTNLQGKDYKALNDIKDVSIFKDDDGKNFNEKLTNKNDFISAFAKGENIESSLKSELEDLYNALDFDANGKVEEKEIRLFAGFGGEDNANVIDKNDVAAILSLSKDSSESFPNNTLSTTNNSSEMKSILKSDSRIQQDENGQKFVKVESWESGANANSSLTAIIKNSYDLNAMGIKEGTDEYNTLLNAVMDANPEIYGNNQGGWRKTEGGKGRINAVLYPNDKIKLPNLENYTKPKVSTTPSTPSADGSSYTETRSEQSGYESFENRNPPSDEDYHDEELEDDPYKELRNINMEHRRERWAADRQEREEYEKNKSAEDVREEAIDEAMKPILQPEITSYHPGGITDEDVENFRRKREHGGSGGSF